MSTEPLLGVGSTIGSYRIVAVLGRGGMGVVYRAEDVRLGRHVALKLLSSSLADDDRYRERFLRESRLAASIEHAAILPIYDAGEKDGLLYIAMRFVDGADLAELLRREGPLEPERAVALVGQIASALDAAHVRGLIHRDVKPSNALIGTDGDGEHAYLVDFGITQEMASRERLTATGQLVGTLDYLAPERLRGEEVDGRADIYALGCVLFECLTGQVPFRRESEAAAIYAHLEEQPPRPSTLRPGLPEALDDVVARSLAKDRADRFKTGAELRAAALAAIERRPAASRKARRAGLPRRGLVAAVALLVLAIAAGIALLVGDGSDKGLRVLDGDVVGRIDGQSGDILAQYPVGRDPGALAVGAGSVWASSQRDESVMRIDPKGGRVVAIPVRDDPAGVAFATGSLWVANRQGRTVSQIDPRTNTILQEIEVGNAPTAVAAGFGALWVASDADRKVFRVDLARAKKTDEVDLAANASAVAVGAGAVWVASAESGSVFRIEPGSPDVVSNTIDVGNGPAAVVATEQAVWVANRQDGTVSRIDPATDRVTDLVPVGAGPAALAAAADGIWVANAGDGTVVRIDAGTRRMVETVKTGASPTALVVSNGSLWTAARPAPASHRGGTLQVRHEALDPGPWTGLEPGSYEEATLKLLSLAHDGLVAYRRTDSSSYGGLVGALATSVPEPSPDGKTYVFKLRPGLRYSDGKPVQPADFRASMEEFLKRFGKVHTTLSYERIRGARRCASRPERCDLSKGIVTDPRAGTITLRLSEPDPELLDKLAYPFAWVAPADQPFRPRTPVPSTGPYRAVRLSLRDGVRLVRNPNFRPRDGRPDGLPDEIRFSFTKDFDANVAAVERNEADAVVVASPFGSSWSSTRISGLAARAPGRLHTDAGSELDYMFLNVRVPPFDDPRVRRALNYAVDRREIERRAGGANLAQLACGLPPPGFPGYEPSCRYTVEPTPGGGWTAPSADRARRLIARSGTKGQKVTIWGYTETRATLAYFAQLLRRLGYDTSLKVFSRWGDYGQLASDSSKRVQIGIMGWASDVAVPSNFAVQFRCSSFSPATSANQNLAGFCDRRIEARAREALHARGSDADAIWQDVYRMLDAAAPYVALVHRRSLTLVSERIGNYQYHPLYGPLYEQMWVR